MLQVADPERAFLTVDSGFPITDLEEALQKNAPFAMPYGSAPLPVLFEPSDWYKLGAAEGLRFSDMLDLVMSNPAPARLYWAMSQMDVETGDYLQRSMGLRKLQTIASMLDFYGNQLSIRSNRVLVPGGTAAEPAWASLVGTRPDSPAGFVERLYLKDEGWLAAYFDVISRVDSAQQQHLTQLPRLRAYYDAFRPPDKKVPADRGIYRNASELLLLDTRLTWDANGAPHVPGNLEIWKKILEARSNSHPVRDLTHRTNVGTPDQLIEALSAASQQVTESGPVQLYLALCAARSRRALRPVHRRAQLGLVLMAGAFSLVHVAHLVGLFPSAAMSLPLLAMLGVSLWFAFTIARTALDAPLATAIGVVVLDFLISLMVWSAAERLG